MEAKFKVGDKVRVNISPELSYRCSAVPGMLGLNGETLTISEVFNNEISDSIFNAKTDGYTYKTKENDWNWTSAMFIKVNNQETIEKSLTITLKKAREIFNNNCSEDMKILLLSNFTEEELTKPALPNTWREFYKNYPIKPGESWINSIGEIKSYTTLSRSRHFNILPNKETAEAMLALCQLIQLRDCYNQGWEPNWEDITTKYVIMGRSNSVIKSTLIVYQTVLAFKTRELRDKFFDNFKDLLEIAKPLL